MAGIGFVLRRLVRANQLSANLAGFAHATLASSGPWLFTCAVLLAISILGRDVVDRQSLRQFSVLVTYNFSLSMVGSGAIVLVVTRSLANALYARDVRAVSSMLTTALTLTLGVMSVVGLVLYGVVLELPMRDRFMGYIGLLLIGGIWVVAAFVSALKSYANISASFLIGMGVALFASMALAGTWGLTGLLLGFSLGLVVILFSLLGRVLAEFSVPESKPFFFLPELRLYWQLGWTGLLLNAGLWIDKWIMWFAPGATSLGHALWAHEAYEGAMFLAYLSIVPSLALLLVDVETRFYEVYLRYYQRIAEHATLDEIGRNHAALIAVIGQGFQRIAMLQGVICVCGWLAAPALVVATGGGAEMVPILRYGLIGAFFHMVLIGAFTVLSYFDLRSEMLSVAGVFFVLNAGLTSAFMSMGGEFHGYGYTLASLLSFAWAFHLAIDRVRDLQYLTFVANNPTLMRPLQKSRARSVV
jgi:uncharacterized membrane protein